MGDIFIVGGAGRERRLDLHIVEDGGDGWRNVLPGYHEVRVHGDGAWHLAGFVLATDGAAALRLDGGRLVDAHDDTEVARLRTSRAALVDVLAWDVERARAWQAATSALSSPLDRLDTGADPLIALQAAFVHAALHDDAAARARLPSLVLPFTSSTAGRDAVSAAAGRAVAAMITLDPPLAAALPAGDLVGALSDAGNERRDPELLAAANALQLALVS